MRPVLAWRQTKLVLRSLNRRWAASGQLSCIDVTTMTASHWPLGNRRERLLSVAAGNSPDSGWPVQLRPTNSLGSLYGWWTPRASGLAHASDTPSDDSIVCMRESCLNAPARRLCRLLALSLHYYTLNQKTCTIHSFITSTFNRLYSPIYGKMKCRNTAEIT